MNILYILPALSAAVIWAWASVVYGDFMRRLRPITVNFLRTTYTSIILLAPALILGINTGALWGSLSGLLSLAVGDSMYLTAISYSGVSIASPVSYTYIPLAVLLAIPLGEPLTVFKAVAGLMIVPGVYLLSRGGESRLTIRGISYALSTALAWALGQTFIKVAYVAGLNPVSVAFMRVASAAFILLILNALMRIDLLKAFKSTLFTILPLVAVLDLGLGVVLFTLSVGLIGLGLTVLVTGITPLIAQVIAYVTGRESFNAAKLAGALVVVAAVALATV